MARTIEREELRRAIADGSVTVVETLRAEHFALGHLPGAIHMHYDEVEHRAARVLPDRSAAIVTYCSNAACANSDIAANRLTAMGYRNVRRYAAGKQDWDAAGLPLEVPAGAAA